MSVRFAVLLDGPHTVSFSVDPENVAAVAADLTSGEPGVVVVDYPSGQAVVVRRDRVVAVMVPASE